ncbi:MAG: hypothetical protein IPJ36_14605 [Simplicispira sp.]|nr:hypothetical protein [Simplicispira sp.]
MNILYYALDDALKKDILLDPGQLQSRQGKYRAGNFFWRSIFGCWRGYPALPLPCSSRASNSLCAFLAISRAVMCSASKLGFFSPSLTIAANRIMAAASKASSDGVRNGLLGVSIVFLLSLDGRDRHGSVEQRLWFHAQRFRWSLPRQRFIFNGACTACGHCCHVILTYLLASCHERVKVHIIRRIFLHGKAMVDAGAGLYFGGVDPVGVRLPHIHCTAPALCAACTVPKAQRKRHIFF